MPPIVILCLQLIIGTVCDASPYIRPALAGPVALFPSAGASSPSLHRSSSSNISTSKRQPTTLIESGDGFAYRQHHQPPGQQKHHQPPDEGHFYGQQHPHFRQPQAFPPDHHVYQPGPLSPFNRGGSGSENFMSEVPSEPQGELKGFFFRSCFLRCLMEHSTWDYNYGCYQLFTNLLLISLFFL